MAKGIQVLGSGFLKKWVKRTVRARGLMEQEKSGLDEDVDEDEGEGVRGDMDDEDGDSGNDPLMTFGGMHVEDGHLVIDYDGENDNELTAALECDSDADDREAEDIDIE